jgi:hypothetical protein
MKQDIKTLWTSVSGRNALQHAQLCILKAMASKGEDKLAITKHFIRKAFTPITKTSKLANGRTPFDIVQDQFRAYRWGGMHSTILGEPAEEVLTPEERIQYNEIAKSLSGGGLVRRYSYFFGRQDYFDEYQAVQIAHVALELGNKLTADQIKDLHFTVCGVEDLRALEDVERVLDAMKIPYVTFREPDIGNQKTAIGVYPVEEHKRGLLRNYNLLKFKRESSCRDMYDAIYEVVE